MINWRQQIADARERGAFTERDHAALAIEACMAAEVAWRYGYTYATAPLGWHVLWAIGHRIVLAVHQNDFNKAEQVLEMIEDKALELKRAQ